jgi:hypothetical protein
MDLVALFETKVNGRVRVVGIEEPELALQPGPQICCVIRSGRDRSTPR